MMVPMAAPVSPARKELQKKSNIFVVGAIATQLVYMYFSSASARQVRAGGGMDTTSVAIGLPFGLISLVLWIIGVSYYAQSKGYSKWWGAAGLLSCCGVVLLMILPNKWVDTPSGYGPGDYPRPQG